MFCILNIEYRTRNFEQQKFLKELVNILHFDILRFPVQRFCGSKQMTFSRNRNLPALADSGLIQQRKPGPLGLDSLLSASPSVWG
jgi:hypothetical protein